MYVVEEGKKQPATSLISGVRMRKCSFRKLSQESLKGSCSTLRCALICQHIISTARLLKIDRKICYSTRVKHLSKFRQARHDLLHVIAMRA